MSNGHAAFFGWAEQVAYATAVTPPAKWVECESITVGDERKMIHKPLLGNVSRKHTVRGKHDPSLSVKFPLLWEGAEQLIKHALGAVNTTGTNPYTHAFTCAAALPAGLTCYADIDDANISGDHVQQLIGAKIDKLTLTQEMDGTLDAEIEFFGREWVAVARTSPTIPTYNAADYSQMTLATINPASANFELPLRKFKLEINNNLFKERFVLTGAGKRSEPPRGGQRAVMVETEIEYTTNTALEYFKAATATDLRFKWVNSAKELTITTPTGYFQGSRPSASDPGFIYINMPYDALMTSADNNELAITLVNTVSSV